MLPESLLCLLSVTIAYAQRPQLAVNSVTSHNTLREAAFAIPAQGQLSISVAVCSDSTTLPRFFVTNVSNADSQNDPGSDLGLDVFEIALNDGQGSWTGSFANGGVLSAVLSSTTGVDYNVGVSTNGKPLNYLNLLEITLHRHFDRVAALGRHYRHSSYHILPSLP